MQKKTPIDNNIDWEYNSLSELVQTHLSLIKPNGLNVKNVSVTNKPEANEISVLSDNVSKLNLLGGNQKITIDLTAALTTVDSKPSIVRTEKPKVEKPFEIPFIDCETEVAQPVDLLECKLDISDVMFLKCNNFKGVSKFGKALCRRYKRLKPYNINFKRSSIVHCCKVFNFTTPSPDDVILSCLKKAK